MIPIDLSSKTAVITGSSQGLGASVAAMLHRAGANVVINYWSDPQGANQAKADALVATLGERAMSCPGDVRDLAQMEALIAASVKRFGTLDIVVANAGIVRDKTLKKMTADEWEQVISTNLGGVFALCKAAEPHLAAGGRIVTVSSISGAVGFFGQANYAAAKAGVIGFTKVLSR